MNYMHNIYCLQVKCNGEISFDVNKNVNKISKLTNAKNVQWLQVALKRCQIFSQVVLKYNFFVYFYVAIFPVLKIHEMWQIAHII